MLGLIYISTVALHIWATWDYLKDDEHVTNGQALRHYSYSFLPFANIITLVLICLFQPNSSIRKWLGRRYNESKTLK